VESRKESTSGVYVLRVFTSFSSSFFSPLEALILTASSAVPCSELILLTPSLNFLKEKNAPRLRDHDTQPPYVRPHVSYYFWPPPLLFFLTLRIRSCVSTPYHYVLRIFDPFELTFLFSIAASFDGEKWTRSTTPAPSPTDFSR